MNPETSTPDAPKTAAPAFPTERVKKLLQEELTEKEIEAKFLTGNWEPAIDSLELVDVVLSVERLIGCKIKPEDIIRRGGYKSVDEGVNDMLKKIESRWSK